MKIIKVISAAVIVFSFIKPVYALQSSGALGMKIGSLGVGIEGRTPINNNIFVRLGVNYFPLEIKKNNAVMNVTLLSVPLMLDFHPFDDSGFRVSGGVAYNGNKLTLKTTTYREDRGNAKIKLQLGEAFAGLISIGYDASFKTNNLFSFNCEAGLMYTGDPKLSVSTTRRDDGRLKDVIQSQLNKHKKYFKMFPVVSIGFKYNFPAI